MSAFPGLQIVHATQARLLSSPLGNEALPCCPEEQLNQLELVGDRLGHLHMHDGITILYHSLSIPKLLHILRTSPAFSSPLLESWDHLNMAFFPRITNINFKQGDASWSQANLPLNSGGLGFRSASNLATSAFLALLMESWTLHVSSYLPICQLPCTVTGTWPCQHGQMPCPWTQPFLRPHIGKGLGTSW